MWCTRHYNSLPTSLRFLRISFVTITNNIVVSNTMEDSIFYCAYIMGSTESEEKKKKLQLLISADSLDQGFVFN